MFASHAYDLGSILNASQTKKQEQQVFPQFNSILYFFFTREDLLLCTSIQQQCLDAHLCALCSY